MSEGHPPVLFILPEQANLTAEQDMVRLHPNGGTMDISILSFTRLAFQVFDELNVQTEDLLDDYGKSMLVMKVMRQHRQELPYYGSMLQKNGFVQEVKSILSEFYQYQVTDQALEQVIGQLDPSGSLYHKLKDLRVIRREFDAALKGSYMVTEQILSRLKEVAGRSGLLRGAEIYFDGFTGFTPVQYDLLGELMKVAGGLYFSFTMDADLFGKNAYGGKGLFRLAGEAADKLMQLAGDQGVKVLPHVDLTQNFRLEGREELLHLERQIFRYPVKTYGKRAQRIRLVSAEDAAQEIDYVAETIRTGVMEQGYRYRDFAVIVPDLADQTPVWKQKLMRHQIPFFLDETEPLGHNPMAELLSAVGELYCTDFSFDSVFALLKTGFLANGSNGLYPNQIYELENYALKYGIRGYGRWSDSFKGSRPGLKKINESREKFINQIAELSEAFRHQKATAEQYIRALYRFMDGLDMAGQLERRADRLEAQGRLQEAATYRQVYERWIEVLDKTMDLLGEEELDREHFMEILMTGIGEIRLGVIPSTLDQVVVGDLERTRLSHVRVIFVTGMNEGLIPKKTSGQGLLLDRDRERLRALSLALAPDTRDVLFDQQYYWYLQVTQASEAVYLISRRFGKKQEMLTSSPYVNRLASIFPELPMEDAGEFVEAYLPATPAELTERFVEELKQPGADASVLDMMEQHLPKQTLEILDGYLYDNQPQMLSPEMAGFLYGKGMQSVSRLETYAGCAYRYFLQYGLALSKREEYRVEATQVGTILHKVLEQFFRDSKAAKTDLAAMEEEELDRLARELTVSVAEKVSPTVFDSSSRLQHQRDVLIRIASRTLRNLCRHLKKGDLKPELIEYEFQPEEGLPYTRVELPEEMYMMLKGVVDRVDIRERDGKVYFRVIDYKSGNKEVAFDQICEGKQLQLTVYMSVIQEYLKNQYPGKEIIPAGMFYYHVQDPVVSGEDEESLEELRIRESRLTGLANRDDACLELLDGRTGEVVPVKYNKDGSPAAVNKALVSTEELERISAYVRDCMARTGEEIFRGNIAMNPEKGSLQSPCGFCDFQNVCRFEPGLGGNRYRVREKMTEKEAREKVLSTDAPDHAAPKAIDLNETGSDGKKRDSSGGHGRKEENDSLQGGEKA